MTRFLSLLLLAALSFFAVITAVPVGNHKPAYYPYQPVRWRTPFRVIPADTDIELWWEGGSGKGYEVYYIPQWAGQEEYSPIEIAQTTKNTLRWHTPNLDAWPEGTTFIVGVNDVHVGQGGQWYALTGLVAFVQN